jgi:hypothetical protein
MSEAPTPKALHLVEAKPLTFIDHVVNIFHLVIKELRSIRADPVMLLLVVYSFSISVNTVATGAVTEATNLSVGHRRRGRVRPVAPDRGGADAANLSSRRCRSPLPTSIR